MKRLLVALAVLAALGAYIYFVEIEGTEKEQKAEDTRSRLIAFSDLDVDRVELTRGGAAIVLEKHSDDEWRMLAPITDEVDEVRLGALLRAVEDARVAETVENAGDLESYGLADPLATLRLTAGSRTATLALGRTAPVSGASYVRRDGGNDVLLVSAPLQANMVRTADDFRDRTVFSFAADDITAMTVTDGGATMRLVKKGDDWRLTAPSDMDADDTIAMGMARDLAGLRISRFASSRQRPPQALGTPEARVAVELANGRKAGIAFGRNENQDRAARVDGRESVFYVADFTVQQLRKKPLDLRNRRLFEADAVDVQRLVFYEGPSETVTLSREGDGWRLAGTASGAADAARVDALFDKLQSWRAQEWQAADEKMRAAYGLRPPHRRLEAYNGGGKRVALLSLGNDADEWSLWVQTDDGNAVAKAPSAFLRENWPADPTLLLVGNAETGTGNKAANP